MVARHVVTRLNVPRPLDSKTHPTSARGVGDGLGSQSEHVVAFIGALEAAGSAAWSRMLGKVGVCNSNLRVDFGILRGASM